MRYRWKKTVDKYDDEEWSLYLILDGKKYGFANINWYSDTEEWELFVSGFVCDDVLDIERTYDLLCDAKEAVMNYMTVWWVTGAMQRMHTEERRQWQEFGTA